MNLPALHRRKPSVPRRVQHLSGLFLVLLLPAFLCCACGGKAPPSMVLILVDTLRADRLGLRPGERCAAPEIRKALAEKGTAFLAVQAASPWTTPSVAAVVTGRYPDEEGIRDLRDPLPPQALTLAERLRAAGWHTAAVVSNALAGPAYGLDQGYASFHLERYKGPPPGVPGSRAPRPAFTADKVTDRALDFLQDAEPPFFLYVHYTDPHEPYLAPPEWRGRFLRGKKVLDEEYLASSAFAEGPPVTPEVLESIEACYDAEVAFADREIARLLARVPGDAVVVLVGDHGEEFMEHGRFLHGHTLFQELLDVPLVFRGPGIPAGRKVTAPVSHVDIVPTLLELAGLSPEGSALSGRSLVPFFRDPGARPAERLLFSVLETKGFRCTAVRKGRWKLHLTSTKPSEWLYDLEKDPREQDNLAGKEPEILVNLMEAADRRAIGLRAPRAALDPEAARRREEELRAIGYVK